MEEQFILHLNGKEESLNIVSAFGSIGKKFNNTIEQIFKGVIKIAPGVELGGDMHKILCLQLLKH
jgi:hypothetical protein